MPAPRLHIEALTYQLEKGTVALESPCVLEAGSLYLVEGASGVGKSSLARTLLGLGACVAPALSAECRVRLEDGDGQTRTLWDESGFHSSQRACLGFLPQLNALSFVDDLSPEENLALYSGLPRAQARREIEILARRFGVWPLPARVARASGGERMRMSAVRALLPRGMGDPGAAVLLADEPTTGLDLEMARELARSLLDLAGGGEKIVLVITHDPTVLLAPEARERLPVPAGTIRITRCRPTAEGAIPEEEVAIFRLAPRPPREGFWQKVKKRLAETADLVGALLLSPLAFAWGALRMDARSARAGLRAVLRTTFGPGTWIFVGAAAIVVGVTLSYFAFEKMPKRAILEPLFLPDLLRELGLAMLLVLPPLFAALFSTAKTGAAQAARLASAVRSGLHETLAMARIEPESYALVPAVLGQTMCLYLTTALAMVLALGSSALVHLASGSALSLDLTLQMMLASLERTPGWEGWLLAKTTASGAAAGVIAVLFGLRRSSGSESGVSDAVHSTLLWTLLVVLAIQCVFILAQFT